MTKEEMANSQVTFLLAAIEQNDMNAAMIHLGLASLLYGLTVTIVQDEPGDLSIANGEWGFGVTLEDGTLYPIGG